MKITPVSDFRAHSSAYVKKVTDEDEVVILVRWGRPVAVVIGYESYTAMIEKIKALESGFALP